MGKVKKRKLFAPSNGPDCVILNWAEHPEEDLKYYAEAFHNMAKKLASQYKDEWPLSSFEACPIVYLYRHSFELYLKATLVYGNELLLWRNKKAIDLNNVIGAKSSHILMNYIPDLVKVFKEAGWKWDWEIDGFRSRKEFTDIVKEFDKYDVKSFTFRYPMDKNRKYTLPKHFSFGMVNFMSLMDHMLKVLHSAICGLEQIVDSERQAR